MTAVSDDAETPETTVDHAPPVAPAPESVPPAEPTPARPTRGRGGAFGLLLLALLAASGAAGWWWWQQRDQAQQAEQQATLWQQQIAALAQQNTDLLTELKQQRERQHTLEQRIADLGAGAKVMREELLGVGDRAAALEDALARLARSRREGTEALRLDEVEYLLQLAGERLDLFGDRDMARRALAHAADSLARLDDPVFAGVRQTLADEQAMLAAAAPDPRPVLRSKLAAVQNALDTLPPAGRAPGTDSSSGSRWQQLLGSLVTVRRLDASGAVLSPVERATRVGALRLQLDLAALALARADTPAWQAALSRATVLFDGLYDADAAATVAVRDSLQSLAAADPEVERPALGTALRELRNLRQTRQLPATADAPAATTPPVEQP